VPKIGARVTTVDSKKEAECFIDSDSPLCVSMQQQSDDERCVIIPVIIRADVAGTLEAIEGELLKITHPRVLLRIISKGVGAVTENDVKLAIGSENAVILAFNVKHDALAQDLVTRNNVNIHDFTIIYKLTEFIDDLVRERAPHIEVKTPLGELRILRFFSQQKDKQVLGGHVESGKIIKDTRFTILRKGIEIGEGKILELQQQKMKSQEVTEGNECGLMVESRFTIAERDVLVPFIIEKKQ
jgi:translation initiation factor IF-2